MILGVIFLFVTKQPYLTDFMIGLLLAELWQRKAGQLQRWFNGWRTGAALFVALILTSCHPGWIHLFFERIPLDAMNFLYRCAGFSWVFLALFCPPVMSFFSRNLLVWLGKQSFALYVIHPLALHLVGHGVMLICVKNSIGTVPAGLIGFCCMIPATLLASILLTRWVDQPSLTFSDKIGRWLTGQTSRDVAASSSAYADAGAMAIEPPLPHSALSRVVG